MGINNNLYTDIRVKVKVLSRAQWRIGAAPISDSIALGHASANAVKATVGGWSTGSSASLTFPLHSHMSSARREGSEYHFKSLWYYSAGTRTYDLTVVRQTLYHWAITPVYTRITGILNTNGAFNFPGPQRSSIALS